MANPIFNPNVRIPVEPMIAYRGEVAPWARIYETRNPFYTFWHLEAGHVWIEWSAGRRRVSAGHAVLIPSGLRRRHHFSSSARVVSLSFRAGWGDGRWLPGFKEPRVAAPAKARSLVAAALDVVGRIQEEAGHQTPSGQLAIHGSLELFVAGIWDWMNPKGDRSADVHSTDARLLRVLESLNSQLRAGPLPFESWKRETGLSRVQLERIARKQLGVSLRAHRDERLLSEIRRSLASGRESLKETAARLGFFDAPHFNRWVRKHTGRSPRELQRAWD